MDKSHKQDSTSYTPQYGDIVAWQRRMARYPSVAVMMNNDEFSVCLNFSGHKDEETCIREWDNLPLDVTIRRASRVEMARLFAELVRQGYEFHATDGKVKVVLDIDRDEENDDDDNEEDDAIVTPLTHDYDMIPVALTRNERFAAYIYRATKMFRANGSFRYTSRIAKELHITACAASTLLQTDIHKLADIEWLRTVEGRRFCDTLYAFVLSHTKTLPLIPKSQQK